MNGPTCSEPRARSGPLLLSVVNKVLLKHSNLHPLTHGLGPHEGYNGNTEATSSTKPVIVLFGFFQKVHRPLLCRPAVEDPRHRVSDMWAVIPTPERRELKFKEEHGGRGGAGGRIHSVHLPSPRLFSSREEIHG